MAALGELTSPTPDGPGAAVRSFGGLREARTSIWPSIDVECSNWSRRNEHHRLRELPSPGRAAVRRLNEIAEADVQAEREAAEPGPADLRPTRYPAQVRPVRCRQSRRQPSPLARAHHGWMTKEQRSDRGGAEGRAAARGRRDVEPRARHRHGRGGPRRAGRVAALRRQRSATGRPRRPPRRRAESLAWCSPSTAAIWCSPRSSPNAWPPGPSRRCDNRAIRSTCSPSTSWRWWRCERLGRARTARLVRRAAPFAEPAAVRVRRRARHAGRPLPERRLRRAATAAGVGPGGRHADGPPRRAAAGGHQRRHDPRPRTVRRLPGSGRRWQWSGPRGSASSTRRWSTSRGSATSSRSAPRRGGSRTSRRPRARLAGAGTTGAAAVLEGRRARSTDRARPRRRRVRPRTGRARPPSRRRSGWLAPGSTSAPQSNLLAYLAEQRAPTGHVPDDRTIVVERFRDELGDWRLVVHSPFGAQVHAPWALASRRGCARRYGVDVQAMHADDGVIVRLPRTATSRPRPISRRCSPPTTSSRWSRRRSAASALFAPGSASARLARCCSPAAIPPAVPRCGSSGNAPHSCCRWPAAPGSFPIVLETMRECLQDVFDVPGLRG